jgi:hypothetical protein
MEVTKKILWCQKHLRGFKEDQETCCPSLESIGWVTEKSEEIML